jgi:hypothetical protein
MNMSPQAQAATSHTLVSNVIRGLSPGTIAGLVLIPLGAWAALEPFVFGGWAWEWHFGRFLLAVLPGAVALLGGLIMLSGRKRAVTVGGGLALAGGLWFVAAPLAYGLVAGSELGTLSGGESVRLLQWMPFFFGAGALVALVSAYGLGLLAPLQFGDEAWSQAVTAPSRKRVPPPPERPRRQRGGKESVGRKAGAQTLTKRPAPRDS